MAKLLPPYTLCPLIEHRKCLGVCEDSTPGCVIVTLGKNIVIRYRLSDQKQVSSWSSKDKLSAPVIFDFNSKRYVAVFKSDQIAFWNDSLVQLNKLKKSKFARLIYNVLSSKDSSPVIVYQNGVIGTLHDEMTSRKRSLTGEQYLDETEEILCSSLVLISGYLYVNLLTLQKKTNVKTLHFIPVDADRADRFKINLEDRDTVSFNCHAVIENESTTLVTLWSDGSIYSIDLPLKDLNSFPGRLLAKVESVDLLQEAVIQSVGEQQIVIYGAAPNSEGAVLCVLNLKYGLIESLQKLKVYSDTPRLWVVGAIGTNRDILCLSGGYLVVVPTRFVTQRLCSLMGVAKFQNDPPTVVATASWKLNAKDRRMAVMDVEYSEVTNDVQKMRDTGFTDHKICEQLLPQLLDNQLEGEIMELLSLIKDVPDHWLIEMAIKFSKNPKSEPLVETILRCPLVSDNSSLQLVRF